MTEEVYEFGAYDILVRPGKADRLVLTIAGIGIPEEDRMSFEWRQAIERSGFDGHALFLRDKSRSWMNNPDGLHEVFEFIRAYRIQHGITHATVMGLSMGGFDAFILDYYVQFDRVVSFSPQLYVGQAHSFDPRYRNLWAKIASFPHPEARLFTRPDAKVQVIFSLDDPYDVFHIELVKDLPSLRFTGCHGSHNIGHEMSARGCMNEFIQGVLSDSPRLASLVLLDLDEAAIDALLTLRRTPTREAALAFYQSYPALLPTARLADLVGDADEDAYPVQFPAVLTKARLTPYLVSGPVAAARRSFMRFSIPAPASGEASANLRIIFSGLVQNNATVVSVAVAGDAASEKRFDLAPGVRRAFVFDAQVKFGVVAIEVSSAEGEIVCPVVLDVQSVWLRLL